MAQFKQEELTRQQSHRILRSPYTKGSTGASRLIGVSPESVSRHISDNSKQALLFPIHRGGGNSRFRPKMFRPGQFRPIWNLLADFGHKQKHYECL